eukprot:3997570-Pyramimonas_sp.AAC.1
MDARRNRLDTRGDPMDVFGAPIDAPWNPMHFLGGPADFCLRILTDVLKDLDVFREPMGTPLAARKKQSHGIHQESYGCPKGSYGLLEDPSGCQKKSDGLPKRPYRPAKDSHGLPKESDGLPKGSHGCPEAVCLIDFLRLPMDSVRIRMGPVANQVDP